MKLMIATGRTLSLTEGIIDDISVFCVFLVLSFNSQQFGIAFCFMGIDAIMNLFMKMPK